MGAEYSLRPFPHLPHHDEPCRMSDATEASNSGAKYGDRMDHGRMSSADTAKLSLTGEVHSTEEEKKTFLDDDEPCFRQIFIRFFDFWNVIFQPFCHDIFDFKEKWE